MLSGCVEQENPITVTSPKDGVIIKKFWFDSSNIFEEDEAILNLELQNIGEVKANGIRAILFGPDWIPVSTTTTTLHLSPSEPEVQIEGESRIVKWELTAPKDLGTQTTYDIGTRVIYKYTTVYTGTLRIVKDVYLETLTEQDRNTLLEKDGVVSSKVTGGPLSVNPVKGRNFIISSGGGTRPIVFKLTNSGSGYPSSTLNIDSDKYKVTISSETGFAVGSCESYSEKIMKLSKGESRLFACDFDISDHIVKHGPIINKEDIVFSITFDYYYYVDDITSVTVNPLLDI